MKQSQSARKLPTGKTPPASSSSAKRPAYTPNREDPNTLARLNASEERVAQLEVTVNELRTQMAKMILEMKELKQVGQIAPKATNVARLRHDSNIDPITPARSRSTTNGALRSSRPTSARKQPIGASSLPAASPQRSIIDQNEALVGCQCWLEISIGGRPKGKIIFDLYWDIAPKTCENFRAMCTGERGRCNETAKKLHYKGTRFHRILPGFIAQGGDIINHDGTSGTSIYGSSFPDENFIAKHDGPGVLSMANAGPNTNGSQFFITTVATSWLDGKNVVFGKIAEGLSILQDIEKVGTKSGKPKRLVIVTNCGIKRVAGSSPPRSASLTRVPSRSTTPSKSLTPKRKENTPHSGSRSGSVSRQNSKDASSSSTTPLQTPSKKTSKDSSDELIKVFMEFTVDREPLGRIVIELRNDLLPNTCENFRALCTGELNYGYEGSRIHRIFHDFLIQGGDITSDDGMGGRSAFSDGPDDPGYFEDEDFSLQHNGEGVVSMANCGPNTNTSQFMLLLKGYQDLDGKNVAFGKVVEGINVLREMNKYCFSRDDATPSKIITISSCGQL
jgi:cyclophilin family peptidyl-prolyl cis-trans isomerase